MLPTTTETTYPTLFKKFVGSGLNQWSPAKKICADSIELLNLKAVAFIHHEEQFAKKKKQRHRTLTKAVSETVEFPASDWQPEVNRIEL